MGASITTTLWCRRLPRHTLARHERPSQIVSTGSSPLHPSEPHKPLHPSIQQLRYTPLTRKRRQRPTRRTNPGYIDSSTMPTTIRVRQCSHLSMSRRVLPTNPRIVPWNVGGNAKSPSHRYHCTDANPVMPRLTSSSNGSLDPTMVACRQHAGKYTFHVTEIQPVAESRPI